MEKNIGINFFQLIFDILIIFKQLLSNLGIFILSFSQKIEINYFKNKT
jgi:hypothetical protein